MKKIVAVILSAVLCFVLFGCGADNNSAKEGKSGKEEIKNTIEIGKPVTVQDYAEITLRKVVSSDKVQSIKDEGYIENTVSGEKYIDCIADVKNLTAETIMSEDFLTAKAKSFYGTEYTADVFAVELDYGVYTYSELKPQSKNTMHIAISVPESEPEFTITFSINDEMYSFDYKMGEVLRNAVSLTKDSTVGDDKYATLKFIGIDFTDDVIPSNVNDYYGHYAIENSTNTYMVIKTNVTNYQSTAKAMDKLVFARATFSGKYEYSGFVVRESSSGDDFDYNPVNPLENANIYIIIEVPKTVIETPYEVSLIFNNQEYLISK